MTGDTILWKSSESVKQEPIQAGTEPSTLFTPQNQTGKFQVKAMLFISEGLV